MLCTFPSEMPSRSPKPIARPNYYGVKVLVPAEADATWPSMLFMLSSLAPPIFTFGATNNSQWAAWWADGTTTFCALATPATMLTSRGATTPHYLPCKQAGEQALSRGAMPLWQSDLPCSAYVLLWSHVVGPHCRRILRAGRPAPAMPAASSCPAGDGYAAAVNSTARYMVGFAIDGMGSLNVPRWSGLTWMTGPGLPSPPPPPPPPRPPPPTKPP